MSLIDIPGPDPLTAILLLHTCSLLSSVFTPHSDIPFSPPNSYDDGVEAAITLHSLAGNPAAPAPQVAAHPTLTRLFQEDVSTRARLSLAALLTPVSGLTYAEKGKQLQAAEYIMRNSLKVRAWKVGSILTMILARISTSLLGWNSSSF
jgi:hypothetical protein